MGVGSGFICEDNVQACIDPVLLLGWGVNELLSVLRVRFVSVADQGAVAEKPIEVGVSEMEQASVIGGEIIV